MNISSLTEMSSHELLRHVRKFVPPLLECFHKGSLIPFMGLKFLSKNPLLTSQNLQGNKDG
jgi:hypothetical protein